MPYHIELTAPFIRVSLSGTVTGMDLIGVALALEQYERDLARVPDRLVDLSGMEAAGLTFHVAMQAARYRRTQRFPNAFRSALVAPTAASQGFAKIFQTINTNPQIDLQIFGSVADAELWLDGAVAPLEVVAERA